MQIDNYEMISLKSPLTNVHLLENLEQMLLLTAAYAVAVQALHLPQMVIFRASVSSGVLQELHRVGLCSTALLS